MVRPIPPIALIFLLWTAGLMAGMQFGKIAVPLAEFRALYPHVGDSIGWLLSLVSLLGAIFGVVAGVLASTLGMRRVMLGCLVIGGLLSLVQSSFPGFGVFTATRVVEGVSHLGLVVAAPTLIAETANDKWRGTAMALWSSFFAVAFALVAWFGGTIIATVGLGGLFQLHGVAMLVIAGALAVTLPEPQMQRPPSQSIAATFRKITSAYARPSVLWPGVAWLIYTFTFLALLTVLPEQLPPDQRGPAGTVMSLIGIITSLLVLPLVLQRVPATVVVLAAFAATAVVIVVGTPLPLVARAAMIFVVLGLIQGGVFAAVSQINRTESDRALGFGIMAQTGNLGNLLGTPIVLALVSGIGLTGMFTVVVALFAGATGVLWVLGRKFNAQG